MARTITGYAVTLLLFIAGSLIFWFAGEPIGIAYLTVVCFAFAFRVWELHRAGKDRKDSGTTSFIATEK